MSRIEQLMSVALFAALIGVLVYTEYSFGERKAACNDRGGILVRAYGEWLCLSKEAVK